MSLLWFHIKDKLFSKLTLLFLTLCASLVFTKVPAGLKKGFPYSDMVVSLEYYVSSIYGFLILIALCGVIAYDEVKYKFATWVFFALMVADMFDWILCYNEEWFYINSFPVSMNNAKSIIFGLTILITWIKNLFK